MNVCAYVRVCDACAWFKFDQLNNFVDDEDDCDSCDDSYQWVSLSTASGSGVADAGSEEKKCEDGVDVSTVQSPQSAVSGDLDTVHPFGFDETE